MSASALRTIFEQAVDYLEALPLAPADRVNLLVSLLAHEITHNRQDDVTAVSIFADVMSVMASAIDAAEFARDAQKEDVIQ